MKKVFNRMLFYLFYMWGLLVCNINSLSNVIILIRIISANFSFVEELVQPTAHLHNASRSWLLFSLNACSIVILFIKSSITMIRIICGLCIPSQNKKSYMHMVNTAYIHHCTYRLDYEVLVLDAN